MVMLVVLFLCTARVQGKPAQPDFSGPWLLDAPPISVNTDTTRRLASFSPSPARTCLGEPMTLAFLRITVRRETDSGNTQETRLISIVGGHMGGLSKDGISVGNSTRFETAWRGRALVFIAGLTTRARPHSARHWTLVW